MRYAIVSDIHANIQAWQTVLLDIRSQDVDRIICLGDVVGYGPNPTEVLESLYANVNDFVLGNHDAAVCGKMDADLFHDDARDIVLWTQGRVGRNAIRFLSSLPLSLAGTGFRCAHGEFSHPAMFDYIIEPRDALPSWQTVDEPLLFVGHTHEPAIYLLGASGTPRIVEPQDFVVQPEKRFLVNVGSVGQPRDGDARACYCLYDTEEQSVLWRRLPFDIDAYRQAIQAAGIADGPSCFLRFDPRRRRKPLRDMLSFSPAKTAAKAARDVVAVQQLTTLKRSARRWRALAVWVLTMTAAALCMAGSLWWRHTHRARVIPDVSATPITARSVPPGQSILSLPDAPTAPGAPITAWIVELGNRHRQAVSVTSLPGTGRTALLMQSSDPNDELVLRSRTVWVRPGMRITFEATFKKSPDFHGNIFAAIALTRDTNAGQQRIERFVTKEPNLRRKNDWWATQHTFDVPADASAIQLCIRGTFVGSAAVKDVQLYRRE